MVDLIAQRRVNRERNVALLARSGFAPQPWLPLREHHAELRVTEEIVARVMALGALAAWIGDESVHASDAIRAHVARSSLARALTEGERELLSKERAEVRDPRLETWCLDALWSLVWVLGHDPAPSFDGRAPSPEVGRGILRFAQRGLDASLDTTLARATVRSLADVVVVEDLFFCMHNAALHAAFGEPTGRPAFDPETAGPSIEARRHGLSWCLSPDVGWDDTDLSA